MINRKISKILFETGELLDIKGIKYKPNAYRKAAEALDNLKEDISSIYKKKGVKGLEEIKGVGKSIASKIEEYLKKGKIKDYEELKKRRQFAK
jgi:DNA polymerase (family 10)